MTYFPTKQHGILLIGLLTMLLATSCKTKHMAYKPMPDVPVTFNYYQYSIQSLDETSKCDANTTTAFYEGFSISYHMSETRQVTLTIENKSNKSLIIDKAKSYVLYDGYSHDLFKDVRTGKVTTYNNVQDAINNVQTNESSITLSIPPYSKWTLPIPETNIEAAKFPDFIWKVGDYSFTTYTTNSNIEFVFPYTYDYALAKWKTSRNRVYIGNVHVEKRMLSIKDPKNFSIDGFRNRTYYRGFVNSNDWAEYYQTEQYNQQAKAYNDRKDYVKVVNKSTWLAIGLGLGIPVVVCVPLLLLLL